jgi:hypothetical protein
MRPVRGSEAISFAVAAALLIMWTNVSLQLMQADQVTTLRAMGSFWPSGAAANHGLDPYGPYPLVPQTFFRPLVPREAAPGTRDINLNPPALLPLFQFTALFDPRALLGPWVAANAAIVILTSLLLMCAAAKPLRWWQIFCALPMSPVRDTIWLGQIYGVMLLCAALGWFALTRQRSIAAGIAIGVLAAIKPNSSYGRRFYIGSSSSARWCLCYRCASCCGMA